MSSTGSLLGETNAPKQRGVSHKWQGDPECLAAVRSTKNPTVKGV